MWEIDYVYLGDDWTLNVQADEEASNWVKLKYEEQGAGGHQVIFTLPKKVVIKLGKMLEKEILS